MRRLLLLGLAALLLAPAADAAPGFRYGVAAGEMTSTSALLWTRSNEPGRVRLFVWPAPREGDAAGADHADAVERARPRRPAPRPRAETGDALHLSLLDAATGRPRSQPAARSGPRRAPSADATVRFAFSGDADGTRDPKTGKPAYNGFQVYGRMAAERQRLQHQPRRHDLLRQRGRRRPAGAHRPGQVGEVQAEPRLRAPAQPPPRHRALQPLGRPRVHQRLHARRARRRDLRGGRDRVPRLRARLLLEPRTASTAPSAGASISSSSSSTSARSARRRCGAVVQRRPRADGAAGGAERVRRARAGAREAGAAGVPRRDRRPVPDDARRAPVRRLHARRSPPRPRPGRSSSTRCRSSSSTRSRTTAGRGTRPSGRSLLRFLQRERQERPLPHHRHARELRQRGPAAHARPGGPRSAPGSGRSSPGRSRRTRRTARSTRRSAGPGWARRSPPSSTSRRRRAGVGMACASARRLQLRRGEGDRRRGHRDAEGRDRGSSCARRPAAPAARTSSRRARPRCSTVRGAP